MAVKPEQIKARLKALFPKANLSQKRIDAIAAKLAPKPADDADDTAIDAVITDANDLMDFDGLAKEDDRIRTLEANQKAPADPPVPEPKPADPPAPAPDDAPAWAKGLIESNKKLSEDLEALKTGNITTQKKQSASSLIEASEVLKAMKPELRASWVNRIDVNSDTPLEDQVAALETEYTELTQDLADKGTYSGGAPRGGADVKPTAADVADIVGNMV